MPQTIWFVDYWYDDFDLETLDICFPSLNLAKKWVEKKAAEVSSKSWEWTNLEKIREDQPECYKYENDEDSFYIYGCQLVGEDYVV